MQIQGDFKDELKVTVFVRHGIFSTVFAQNCFDIGKSKPMQIRIRFSRRDFVINYFNRECCISDNETKLTRFNIRLNLN